MSRIYDLASIKEGDIVYISSAIGERELIAFKNDKNKLCLDHYDPKYITSPTIEISTWMSLLHLCSREHLRIVYFLLDGGQSMGRRHSGHPS